MSLTSKSTGINILRKKFNINTDNIPVIALAGNPNTGKSTVFNGLTGLKQHTGNWPGKTVTRAQGFYDFAGEKFSIVDLPGTYSLLVNSAEEKIARDFICFARPDVTVVVADATNLERNLNLVLQITELTDNVILCLNMMDEAQRKDIEINITGLKNDLQIPVVPTVAREGKGLQQLKNIINKVIKREIDVKPAVIKYSSEINESIVRLLPELKNNFGQLKNFINFNWLALRLLEGDKTIINSFKHYACWNIDNIKNLNKEGQVKVNGVIQ